MKYHITPKQAKEVSESQFYSLFDELVKRDNWANYHHKKMTIGKMIDYLDTVEIWRNPSTGLWEVDGVNASKELVDTLWESVKHRLILTFKE